MVIQLRQMLRVSRMQSDWLKRKEQAVEVLRQQERRGWGTLMEHANWDRVRVGEAPGERSRLVRQALRERVDNPAGTEGVFPNKGRKVMGTTHANQEETVGSFFTTVEVAGTGRVGAHQGSKIWGFSGRGGCDRARGWTSQHV